MPKVNSQIETPDGQGTVAYVNLLKKIVTVRLVAPDESVSMKDFALSDLQVKEKMVVEDDGLDKIDVLPDTDEVY